MENLHLAILQADLHWEKPKENLAYFTDEILALPNEVDVVVLPEMFTTGFSMNAKQLAEPSNGRTLLWMKDLALRKQACITGSVMVTDKGKYYNRLYWVYPDQRVEIYNKKHLFTLAKEQETYSPGNKKLVLTYKSWKFCPMVCYDLRFPVWSRNKEEYHVLLYVANWPEIRTTAWDALLKARAIENVCYCVGVNRVGKDGNNYPYSGHSAVYDALGNRLTQSENHHHVFSEMHILSKPKLEKTRAKLGFLNERDDFKLMD